ncbi:MAG: SBBP repeat-containing protein [Terriglobia bacterium]
MKEPLSNASSRFLGAAAILLFVAFYCLLSGSTMVRAQPSQLAVASGFDKTANAKTSKPRSGVSPDPVSRAKLVTAYGNLSLSFEANQGQADSRVKFLSHGGGYTLFLTGDEAVLALRKPLAPAPLSKRQGRLNPWRNSPFPMGEGGAEKQGFPSRRVRELNAEGGKQKAAGSGETRSSQVGTRHLSLVTHHSPAGAQAMVRLKLVGANPAAQVTGLDELPGKSNYFIGNDPKKWRTDVPNYARVEYQGIYPGINLVYYGNHQQLEYDFVVAPGANPSAIRLDVGAGVGASDVAAGFSPATVKNAAPSLRSGQALKGASTGTQQAEALRIAANGDLVMQWGGDEVRFHKPLVYQPDENRPLSIVSRQLQRTTDPEPRTTDNKPRTTQLVSAKYVLNGNKVSFEIGRYDRTKPLIIDPVLTYSSLIGGSDEDDGMGVAVDSSGNAYLTGYTSTDFPIVNQIPGACNGTCGHSGNPVAFVTKINAAGSALVYSSYIGGSYGDIAYGLALDGSDGVYVTGFTLSEDFPVVNQIPGACNNCLANGAVFLTKVNAAGNALAYSSLIGGNGYDYSVGITVDGLGAAYLTGYSHSSDFPIVNQIPGACNGTCGNGLDHYNTFVVKVNPEGTALVYSSWLGGSLDDSGDSDAVDASGDLYVAGETTSSDFPQVNQIPGACNGSCGALGTYDAFVTKINSAGTALVYSSLIGGGPQGDGAYGIAVDRSGDAYLTGWAYWQGFPIVDQIPGACQGTCEGKGLWLYDAFVTKINPAGSAMVYCSLLGGSTSESGNGIAVDASANVYLTGSTTSTDFPQVNPIPGACQGSCGSGITNGFVTEISAAGTGMVVSSYFGGSGGDVGQGVAVDGSGDAYLTGSTFSHDFPRVNQIPGACQGECGNDSLNDVFVMKISPSGGEGAVTMLPDSLVFGPQGVQSPNVPQVVTLTNTGQAPVSITSIAITGQNSGDFAQANNCPLSPNTLAPGDYCSITVVFEPTGAGTLNADVTVTDNAPGSPQSVSLTGVGVSGKPGLAGPQR